jgi:acylphosphatase
MLQTISIIIKGKVQGVFYRQSAKEKAAELGIAGHVCNLSDGTVKVIATGKKEQLDKLISWCRQGPPRAKVTDVICCEESLQSFHDFRIVRDV